MSTEQTPKLRIQVPSFVIETIAESRQTELRLSYQGMDALDHFSAGALELVFHPKGSPGEQYVRVERAMGSYLGKASRAWHVPVRMPHGESVMTSTSRQGIDIRDLKMLTL